MVCTYTMNIKEIHKYICGVGYVPSSIPLLMKELDMLSFKSTAMRDLATPKLDFGVCIDAVKI